MVDIRQILKLSGVPSGGIIMWSGTIANIPSGWIICDGNSGTPNLLAKFVEGVATAATDPGTTGGGTSKGTAGHTHTTDIWASDKTGSILTDSASARTRLRNSGGVLYEWRDSNYDASGTAYAGKRETSTSQTDSIADIRPLYYDLAFLMKT